MGKLSLYLALNGRLIFNDFHPYRKILHPEIGTDGDYFEDGLHQSGVPTRDWFDEAEQKTFSKCLLRYYTIGEIITAIGRSGLCIEEMRELKRQGMEKLPGEFTIVAHKKGT